MKGPCKDSCLGRRYDRSGHRRRFSALAGGLATSGALHRHRREAGDRTHRELLRELPYRKRIAGQPLEDLPAGGISGRLQRPLLVSIHER